MSYFIVRYRVQASLCAMILFNYATIVLMVPSYHAPTSNYGLNQPLILDANTSGHSSFDSQRLSGSRKTFYSWTHQKSSGLQKNYSDFIEAFSRWKLTATTDYTQSSLLNLLPQIHASDSACSFLCYVMINNFYVLVCAYLYWPISRPTPISC